jgi:hypothetical protein
MTHNEAQLHSLFVASNKRAALLLGDSKELLLLDDITQASVTKRMKTLPAERRQRAEMALRTLSREALLLWVRLIAVTRVL